MATGKAVIRAGSEAQRQERMKILTTKERRALPSPSERARRAAEAKAAIAQREFEKKIEAQQQKARQLDIKLGRLEPTRGPVALPTTQSIFAARGGPAITQATSNRYQQRALASIVQKSQQQGITSAKDVQLSGLSTAAYKYTKKFAETTRRGAPILQEKISVVSPTTGTIIRYPIESVVRGAEMAGMIPGGIEVMARRPEVIVPAFTIGAIQMARIGETIAADPKQFVSDIVTLGILFKGLGMAPKVIKKTPAQFKKLAAEETAQLGRVKVKERVDASFERTFKEAMVESKRQAKRDLTKLEESNIRASVKQSHAKQAADIAKADAKTRARKESTLAKDISKTFEKERSTKDTTTARSTRPEPIKPTSKQTSITNITKQSQDLVKKAIRLQDKFERGAISKTNYEIQMQSIMKQGSKIDALRQNAIEVGKRPQTAPVQSSIASAAIKTRARVSTVALSSSIVLAMAMAATRIKAKPITKIVTKPITKASHKEALNGFVKTSGTVTKLFTSTVAPARVPVSKVKRPIPTSMVEEMPLPEIVISKMRPVEKKKAVKVIRKFRKEYTNIQIVNQMGGIAQLFG